MKPTTIEESIETIQKYAQYRKTDQDYPMLVALLSVLESIRDSLDYLGNRDTNVADLTDDVRSISAGLSDTEGDIHELRDSLDSLRIRVNKVEDQLNEPQDPATSPDDLRYGQGE